MAEPLCDMMQPVGVKVIETLHPGGTERIPMAQGTIMETIPMTLPVAQPGVASGESFCGSTGLFSSSFVQTTAYQRWRNIGGMQQLYTDEEIACFLMNSYEKNLSFTSPVKGRCVTCGSPLMLSCSSCGRHLGNSTVPICLGNAEDSSGERAGPDQGSQKGGQTVQRQGAKKDNHVQKVSDDQKELMLLDNPLQHDNWQRPAPPHPIHQQTWADTSQYHQLQAQSYPPPQQQVPYAAASHKQEECGEDLWDTGEQQSPPHSEGKELQEFGTHDSEQSLLDSAQPLFAQQQQEPEEDSENVGQQQQEQTHSQTQGLSFDTSPSTEDKVKEEPLETKQENLLEKERRKKEKKSMSGRDLYCQPCNKQLSSRQAFDRHISSKLHAISLLPPELQAKRRRRKKAINPQQANQDKSVYVVVKTEGKEEYQCKVCSQGFRTVQEVKQHRRQHKEREMCHLCGKTVNVRGFHDHMLRHRGERQYCCHLCPKTFINATLLKDHAIVHTEDKPYCCEVCGACFRHRHTLKFHLRTHLGIKAYRCSQCDAAFTRPRGLSDHMRVHTGEKPYGCQVCGRYFSSSGNLAAHRRKVHKMAPLRANVPCRLLIT